MNKQHWTYKKLGEVATFINGYPFKPTDWKNSGRKIIRIQNLNNPNATYNFYDGSIDPKYLVSNGDVLISWSGSLGVFEWSEDEAILNQHIFKVVFNKGHINKKFFEYVVASRINEMKSKVHGVTMQHITKKEFDVILIPVPPIGEQERIVEELDLLSGIIEKKKEQLKAYDQLAQSIFYTMFGDPIDNPKGWEVKQFGEVFSTRLGKMLDKKKQVASDKEYPYLANTNVRWGTFDLKNLNTMTFNETESVEFELQRGDLMICEGGESGRCAVWNIDSTDIKYQKAIHRARPISRNVVNVTYTQHYIFLFKMLGGLKDYISKATIEHLTGEKLKTIPLLLPPLSLQQEFAEKVEAIERQKALVQQSIEETQTMFDYTMDKYFG